jgi:hypothetical protein
LAMTIDGTLLSYDTAGRRSQTLTASPPTEPKAVTILRASPAVRAASIRKYGGGLAAKA